MASKIYKIVEKQEGYWKFIVTKTDCVNTQGHDYNWVTDKKEKEEIFKQFPKFRGIGIAKCIHCKKIQSTH